MKHYDVCIIGGGASGLAAANRLSKDLKVCLLEKNKILGRKIMATGGGRCNITNRDCRHKQVVLDFFNGLGMELYCDEEGRYFPYSNKASDVVTMLTKGIKDRTVLTGVAVDKVSFDEGGFTVYSAKGNIRTRALVLAAGGKAAPEMGTVGDGYGFAKALGHSITRVYPMLTPIECGDFQDIKGIRARGRVSLYKNSQMIAQELGEIQFTKDGISGICVFNITPYIKADNSETLREALEKFSIVLDLAPNFTEEDIEKRDSSFGILSEKLAAAVDVRRLKCWKLPILGVKGWKDAQCTGGGVPLGEINMETMESRIVKNLYVAGEMTDYQGPCGGYNLQNAWETGIKAATAINEKNEI
ncbi:MAG: FAD-dependent oxidoreductase [Clostridiales bacterium]|nr:FAD-dependent oxidoreductase [Clostridiales bacterium]